CLIRFYRGEWNNQTLPINDDESVMAELKRIWELHSYQEISEQALKNEKFWDQDLTQVAGLKDHIAMALELIETKGIEEGYKKFAGK
ncbi:MAG: altronate oxidoreductase, partial [Zunongwangia sp.]|nr:altronate oxidoreductase [Zunongwangia sp.]